MTSLPLGVTDECVRPHAVFRPLRVEANSCANNAQEWAPAAEAGWNEIGSNVI